jgi:hypothetical protein
MTSKKPQSVGSVWELSVNSDKPVTFDVSGPLGTRQVTASPGDKGQQIASYVLDAEGDFSAVAHVEGSDDVDGFAVTAK